MRSSTFPFARKSLITRDNRAARDASKRPPESVLYCVYYSQDGESMSNDTEKSPPDPQERMKRLLGLLQNQPTGTTEDHAPPPGGSRTLLLNTTAENFSAWLTNRTRKASRRRFVTGNGYFNLQEARKARGKGQADSENTVLTVDGLLHEPGGSTLLQYKMLLFTVFSVAEGIAVQAKCNHPSVANYYEELLAEIDEHFAGESASPQA